MKSQETIFSRKKPLQILELITFMPIVKENVQKHLSRFLPVKLNYLDFFCNSDPLESKLSYLCYRKTQPINTTFFFDTKLRIIHYTSCRLPNNINFSDKNKSTQHNAALAIKRAIKGPSREKLYQKLSLKSFSDRRWLRRL